MKTLRELETTVSPRVLERGRDYFATHRVARIQAEPGRIDAVVNGSVPYAVGFRIDGRDLLAACECRYFRDNADVCKHIWAVFLSAINRKLLSVTDIDELLPDETAFETPVADNVVDISTARAAQPGWLSYFAALRQGLPEPAGSRSTSLNGELLYVLHGFYGVRATLSVELLVRLRRKNGDLGAARRAAISPTFIASLQADDRELVALLTSGVGLSTQYSISAPAAEFLVPRLAATGRLYIAPPALPMAGPLALDDEGRWEFEVRIVNQGDAYHLDGYFVRDEERLPVRDALLVSESWFFTSSKVCRFDVRDSWRWLQQIRTRGGVDVPVSDGERLAEVIAAAPPAALVAPLELELAEIRPRPLLKFEREYADSWKTRLYFQYGDTAIAPSEERGAKTDEGVARRRRDLEQAAIRRLNELPFRASSVDVRHLHDRDLALVVRELLSEEWAIDFAGEPVFTDGEMELELSSGIDWFDLNGSARFGDRSVPLPRLLAAVRNAQPLVRLDGGGVAILSPEWEARLNELAAAGHESEKGLRFSRSQATVVDTLLTGRDQMRVDPDFERIRNRLAEGMRVEPSEAPASFRGELRPYQKSGLGWLEFLREVGFGGILADDMGLGKTIQVLALLEKIRQEPGEKRPTLVVAPRSLMFNWKAEAGRFAPGLRVLDHHGIERIKGSEHFDDYDLILTTYGTLQRDLHHLGGPMFRYVILDEAQAIKNADSQTARAVRTLRAEHRLALSGTPIENHLGELWSVFEFLNPGMLGSRRAFARGLGARSAGPEAREKLARIVRPFVLRRTKEAVLPDLPPKNEQTLWVELSDSERQEYDELREHYRRTLLQRVEREGISKSKMHVLEALLRLRQAACHPALIDPSRSAEPSAKIEALESELAVIVDSGHKALVFSQFTSMLDLLEPRVAERKVAYRRLDGSSRNREELVRDFQENDDVKVFLISLRAGGVGLNLTAADYVFLLDPWWNPAVEEQAIDRAHRMGQERSVFACRIVARDTVEEKILELQEGKRALADSIIRAEDGLLRELDMRDLELLLS